MKVYRVTKLLRNFDRPVWFLRWSNFIVQSLSHSWPKYLVHFFVCLVDFRVLVFVWLPFSSFVLLVFNGVMDMVHFFRVLIKLRGVMTSFIDLPFIYPDKHKCIHSFVCTMHFKRQVSGNSYLSKYPISIH